MDAFGWAVVGSVAAVADVIAAIVFGLLPYFLGRRKQGHVTERCTKAVKQLGSGKLDVRVGGIFALEQIARDSARDHPAVMEVLAAFWSSYWPARGGLPGAGVESARARDQPRRRSRRRPRRGRPVPWGAAPGRGG